MHTKAFPFIGLLSLFWGTNIVASRYGIGEFNPYLFLTLRLSIATLFFLPVLWLNGRKVSIDPTLLRHAILSGILGVTIPMSAFLLSLQYQSSGVTSIYVTAAPASIVIAAHFFLDDERITTNKALGVVLALLGSLFLVLRGESGLAEVSRANPLGFLLVLCGLTSETINTMFVRKRMTTMDPITVTSVRLFVGAICLLIINFLFGDFSLAQVTTTGYFSLVYAALLGAIGGQFLAFYITREFGATAFSLTSYFVPIVAILTGMLFLDEIVTWGMLVGILFVGGGIYLINYQQRPKLQLQDR